MANIANCYYQYDNMRFDSRDDLFLGVLSNMESRQSLFNAKKTNSNSTNITAEVFEKPLPKGTNITDGELFDFKSKQLKNSIINVRDVVGLNRRDARASFMFTSNANPNFKLYGVKEGKYTRLYTMTGYPITLDTALTTKAETEEYLNSLNFRQFYNNLSEENKRKIGATISERQREVAGSIEAKANIFVLDQALGKYVNPLTEEKIDRVSNVINNNKVFTGDSLPAATAIGTGVDNLNRDIMNDALRDYAYYTTTQNNQLFADKKAFDSYVIQVQQFKAALEARGEYIVTNNGKDIVLFDTHSSIGGAVDLLTVDPQGNVRIYDYKTMKGDQFTEKYAEEKEDKVKYESTLFGDSKRDSHTKQQSFYKALFEKMYNIPVESINIVSIELNKYENTDRTVKRADIYKVHQLVPMDINLGKVRPSVSEVSFQEFAQTYETTSEDLISAEADLTSPDFIKPFELHTNKGVVKATVRLQGKVFNVFNEDGTSSVMSLNRLLPLFAKSEAFKNTLLQGVKRVEDGTVNRNEPFLVNLPRTKEEIAELLDRPVPERDADTVQNKTGVSYINSYFNGDRLNVEKIPQLIAQLRTESVRESDKAVLQIFAANPDIFNNIPFIIDYNMGSKGYVNVNTEGKPFSISINPSLFKDEADARRILIEEMIHAVVYSELRTNPEMRQRIETLRESAKNYFGIEKFNKMAEDEKTMVGLKRLKALGSLSANQQAIYDLIINNPEYSSIYYKLASADEFVAGALLSSEFQKFLSNISIEDATMTGVKTMWQDFISIITEFLSKYLGKRYNPVLRVALYDTLNLVETAAEKITREPGILDISGVHRKTTNEVNTMFNLRDENGNLNRVKNVDELTDFINHNIYNVIAMSNADGTINVIYKEETKVNAADVSFDDDMMVGATLDEENSMEDKSGFETRIKSYILNLKARERSILKSLKQNEYYEDQTEEDFQQASANTIKLEQELDHIKTLLKNVTKKGDVNVNNLTMLKEQAIGELEHIREFMNKGMNSADIKYALETTKFWLNAKNMLFNKEDFDDVLMLDSFSKLEDIARLTDNVLIEKLNDWVMDNLVNKYTTNDQTLRMILMELKDLGKISAEVADLSTINSPIMQALGKHIKLKDVELSKKRQDKLIEFDTVIKNASKTLKSYGSPSDRWEIFRQLDDRGMKTRNLVSRFSSKYDAIKKPLNFVWGKTDRTSEEAYEAYRHFNNNTEKFNLNVLLPLNDADFDQAAYDAEEARLIGIMGKQHYGEWLADQSNKIKNYKKSRYGHQLYTMEKFDLASVDEIANSLDSVNYMAVWEEANSPYNVMKHLNNNIIENPFTLDKNYNNFKYLTAIPARMIEENGQMVDSGFYDTKFEIIERNPDLMAVHDKFQDIMKYVGKLLPYGNAERLANGSIPEFHKSMYEAVDGKPKNFFAALNEGLVDMIRTERYEELEQEVDIVTGKVKRDIKLGIHSSNMDISREIYLAENKIFKETGENPTEEQKAEIISSINDKYAGQMKFNLAKVFSMYLNLGIAYENKAESEDALDLTQIMMENQQEYVRNNKGGLVEDSDANSKGYIEYRKKSEKESFVNQKRILDNTIKSLQYGDKRDVRSTKSKIYTKAEKKEKAFYEAEIAEIQASEKYNSVEKAIAVKKLQSFIDRLGAYGDSEKYVDLPIKWTQYVGMGWNVIGGISNMTFGTASNFIEGAGEEFYTNEELMRAYGKVMSSVLRNATFNQGGGREALKIRGLMDTYDIMAESGKEYKDLIGDDITERLKFLSAFNTNQRTEYINQAPIMVAILDRTKFEHNGKTYSLYDGFGIDGKWNTEEYGEYPSDKIGDAIIKVKALIQRNHGNYNPLAPMLAKRTGVGRLLLQFRGWMLEGVKVRLGERNGRPDAILGSEIKGRYWSVVDAYKEQNAGDVTKGMLLQVLRNFVPFKNSLGLSKSPIDMFLGGGSVKPVDIANMKRMAFEMNILIGVMISAALMKYMVGEIDDEDDVRTMALNLLLNQATRLQTDIFMYVNPLEAMKVLQDPVPSMRILSSFVKISNALYDTIIEGSPEYENGVYQGQYKLVKEIGGALPVTRPYFSALSNILQAY